MDDTAAKKAGIKTGKWYMCLTRPDRLVWRRNGRNNANEDAKLVRGEFYVPKREPWGLLMKPKEQYKKQEAKDRVHNANGYGYFGYELGELVEQKATDAPVLKLGRAAADAPEYWPKPGRDDNLYITPASDCHTIYKKTKGQLLASCVCHVINDIQNTPVSYRLQHTSFKPLRAFLKTHNALCCARCMSSCLCIC